MAGKQEAGAQSGEDSAASDFDSTDSMCNHLTFPVADVTIHLL